MITAAQLRAARALLGIDQKTLAERAGVSLPTVQRMEASKGATVRGVVGSLTRIVDALDAAGVELIGNNAQSVSGGRGVRLKAPAAPSQTGTRHDQRIGRVAGRGRGGQDWDVPGVAVSIKKKKTT